MEERIIEAFALIGAIIVSLPILFILMLFLLWVGCILKIYYQIIKCPFRMTKKGHFIGGSWELFILALKLGWYPYRGVTFKNGDQSYTIGKTF